MKKKNNLDEAQELKLLQIEHNAYQIGYWGLLTAIVIQTVAAPGNPLLLAGELLVFFSMCLYVIIACLKAGIYDRRLKPTAKTNLIGSLIAGCITGSTGFAVSYRNYHNVPGSLAAAAFTFLMTFALSYAVMLLTARLYKNRVKKLESDSEE